MNKPHTVFAHTVIYSHRKIIGFDRAGIPIYIEVSQQQTIYACTEIELKKRVTQFLNTIPDISRYTYKRHPRSYIEVVT